MKIVLDSNGNRIPGLFRDNSGVLIVNDQRSLAKYKGQQARERELQTLREQVSDLSSIVSELKQMIERNNNG